MRVNPLSRGWAELAVLTLLSFALYQFNMFFAFLIPLRMVFLRRGAKDFMVSAAAVLAAIVVFGLFRIRPTDSGEEYLRTIGLFWIVLSPLFVVGLYIADAEFRLVPRRLHKALIATGVAAVAGIPLMASIGGIDAVFLANLQLANAYLPGMNDFLASSVGMGVDADGVNLEALVVVIRESFLGTYLFIYFAVIALTIRVSDWLYSRSNQVQRWSLSRFTVTRWMVWILLIPWGLVLINQLDQVELGWAAYPALNLGMIMLLIYGLQGYAIVKAILAKRNASTAVRRLVGFLVVVFLLWPGLRLLIIVGLPGLGVSELWIHYRFRVEE